MRSAQSPFYLFSVLWFYAMMAEEESDEVEEETLEVTVDCGNIREFSVFSMWMKVASLCVASIFIGLLSFLCVHLLVLMLHWLYEERRFYSIKHVNRAILEYYKQQFYLWYLMIRNWDCHEGDKIKVIMPNYLAS